MALGWIELILVFGEIAGKRKQRYCRAGTTGDVVVS